MIQEMNSLIQGFWKPWILQAASRFDIAEPFEITELAAPLFIDNSCNGCVLLSHRTYTTEVGIALKQASSAKLIKTLGAKLVGPQACWLHWL